MSLAMSPGLNRATFAQQSRLFVAMKRAGRVIDLVWFQHSAEYARAVLDIAGHMSDQEVRALAEGLRPLLGEYLNQGQSKATVRPLRPAPAPVPVAVPAPEPAVRAETGEVTELDRHLTSLR